jgi:cystathionine gamma-synthase
MPGKENATQGDASRSLQTIAVRGAQGGDPVTGSVSFPIYQSATFSHPGLGETTGWDYSRQGNPTRAELEETIALLEGGIAGFAFSTGMAAISAILELFRPGDHVLYSEDLYGGTYRLAEMAKTGRGIGFDLVDSSVPGAVEAAWTPNTKAIFIETPSNPMGRISDIAALAAQAHARGALCIVDNTFLTPLRQRPLSLGADIVIHSGTKFISGHNDTLAGLAVCGSADLAEKLRLAQKSIGAVLSPFDSWLTLRGMKTLELRLQRQESSAMRIAEWLGAHPRVAKVYYPGLKGHPGHELAARQAAGPGSMISFRLKDSSSVPEVLSSVRLVIFAESLGGVESLITFPMAQTHAAIPAALRARLGVDEGLLRLSVGIEDPDDVIADLERALG